MMCCARAVGWCGRAVKPQATGLGAEMRAHFAAAVQEEVEKKFESVRRCKRACMHAHTW